MAPRPELFEIFCKLAKRIDRQLLNLGRQALRQRANMAAEPSRPVQLAQLLVVQDTLVVDVTHGPVPFLRPCA